MDDQPNFNRLYEIAENQAGYFIATQAQEVGFAWERLSYYVSSSKFSRIQRGIYRLIQFPTSPYEDLFIAWLKAGSAAVVSHESALNLYKLSNVLPGEVHVIMPRTGSRHRKGLRLHTNRLNHAEGSRREGLPSTSAARTIVDVVTSGIAEEQFRLAVHEAIRQGFASREKLLSMVSRYSSRVLRIIENALDREIK
jgi:predicted transcriptional regulator of viral defense system